METKVYFKCDVCGMEDTNHDVVAKCETRHLQGEIVKSFFLIQTTYPNSIWLKFPDNKVVEYRFNGTLNDYQLKQMGLLVEEQPSS